MTNIIEFEGLVFCDLGFDSIVELQVGDKICDNSSH